MHDKDLSDLIGRLQSERGQIQKELATLRLFKAAREFLSPRGDLSSCLSPLLQLSIGITDADFGNLQLLDPKTGMLKIVAQRGFGAPFLEFFNSVHSGQVACGTAMKLRRGVFVPDVTANPIFRDNETLEVMLAAESRSVRSFPLIASSGRFVGVMSSLYRATTPCTQGQILIANVLAMSIANWIEKRQLAWGSARAWSLTARYAALRRSKEEVSP